MWLRVHDQVPEDVHRRQPQQEAQRGVQKTSRPTGLRLLHHYRHQLLVAFQLCQGLHSAQRGNVLTALQAGHNFTNYNVKPPVYWSVIVTALFEVAYQSCKIFATRFSGNQRGNVPALPLYTGSGVFRGDATAWPRLKNDKSVDFFENFL